MKWESWKKAAKLARRKAEYSAAVKVLTGQSPSDLLRDRCEHKRVAGRKLSFQCCSDFPGQWHVPWLECWPASVLVPALDLSGPVGGFTPVASWGQTA